MKKKLFVLAVLAIILAGMASGTVAYFTAKGTAHNVITSGEIDIELVETMKDGNKEVPYPTNPVGGIMPGTEHSKIVRVENTGTNPAWVRVKVEAKINGDEVELTDSSVLRIDFDDTKWIEEDGYYYYADALVPGGKTATPLFREIHFDGEGMDNAYQNARIEINVQAYATQSQNNPIPANGDVTDVKGWPKDNILTALLG